VSDPAAPGGKRVQTWRFPSRAECMACHSQAAAFVLGLQTGQINRVHAYGGTKGDQLRALSHAGVFTKPLPKPPAEYAAFPEPDDEAAPLESRARAYLHVNCSICHQSAGGGNAHIELRFSTEREKMSLIGAPPSHDKFGLPNPRLVSPGDPTNSVLLA